MSGIQIITTGALPEYTWSQTSEDVTVQFTVPSGVTKADIHLSLTPDHIEFGIKNSKALLKGHMHGPVDVEGSTWTIQGQRSGIYPLLPSIILRIMISIKN